MITEAAQLVSVAVRITIESAFQIAAASVAG